MLFFHIFEPLMSFDGMLSLFTLTVLEIVLGIDNIIFISIISDKLPEQLQSSARTLGLTLALVVRVSLLSMITWLMSMNAPLFTVPWIEHLHVDPAISGKDLILLAGGLFLMAKSVSEIHQKIEGIEEESQSAKVMGYYAAVLQIVVIDIVFSFDSILTATALGKSLFIMVLAVVISMIIMMVYAKKVSDYINDRPTIKMLALSFLVMIGFLLVAESMGEEVPKGYIYFAMLFAFIVEMLNIRMRKKTGEG